MANISLALKGWVLEFQSQERSSSPYPGEELPKAFYRQALFLLFSSLLRIGSLPEESVASPLGQMLYSEELESGTFKINSLWQLERTRGTELPGQHIKQDLGLGLFFLMKKKIKKSKRALNSEEMKILCCHSFQALLDLLIHMCFIFSLKISFSLPEGSNSEFHRITFNRAGTVSQTFVKTS